MNKLILLFVTVVLCYTSSAYTPSDTIKFYFELNVDALNKKATKQLDSLIYTDMVNPRSSILIIGYADFLGTNEHNISLSQRRAKNIQQYLVGMNIPENNIKLCIGKGEIDRSIKQPGGYATDRRVDVVINPMKTTQSTNTKNITKIKASPLKQQTDLKTIAEAREIKLTDLKVGQAIRLNNIFFIVNRHIVTNESFAELDKLVQTMEDNPNLNIQIEGHICCMTYGYDAEDEDTHIRNLSVARAKFIYDYLVQKGIEADRMRYKGFGRSMPLVNPERTTADEEKNRRVEIRIIED